jgi:hypothetical protein
MAIEVDYLSMLFQSAIVEAGDDALEVVKKVTKDSCSMCLRKLKDMNCEKIVDGKKIGLDHVMGEIMKEIYGIALQQMQLSRETFKPIVELKYKLAKLMERLDERRVSYKDSKREVSDGLQLKLYNTFLTLNKRIDILTYMSALIELVSTTKNTDKIIKNLEPYAEEVMEKATRLVCERVAKDDE